MIHRIIIIYEREMITIREKILDLLDKYNELDESHITENLLKSENVSLFILYTGEKRSYEIRSELLKLIKEGKVSFIHGKFRKNKCAPST